MNHRFNNNNKNEEVERLRETYVENNKQKNRTNRKKEGISRGAYNYRPYTNNKQKIIIIIREYNPKNNLNCMQEENKQRKTQNYNN